MGGAAGAGRSIQYPWALHHPDDFVRRRGQRDDAALDGSTAFCSWADGLAGGCHMTTKFVDVDIRQDEGFRDVAYPDPLTGGDPWTVGFGCTGPDIKPGTRWTLAQAVAEQMKRRQAIEVALDQAIPWWRQLCDERQDVLVNMSYQMGVQGVLGFHGTLAACQAQQWEDAASNMLASKWASQTPKRAKRLALQMQTGQRAAQPSAFGQQATKDALGDA